ncbi:MAG: hypothetical protein GY795_13500 [Desulfobacterales bacterium]|nr:hypothetical protein [Desulfobacterales bacterium]
MSNFRKLLITIFFLCLLPANIGFSYAADTTHFTGFKLTPASCNYAGKITINKNNAVDNEDEVGVFVSSDAGQILVGACVTGKVVTSHYFVTVYGDDTTTDEKDGAENNDELIFKVWDKSEDKEYIIPFSSMTSVSDVNLTRPSVPPTWTDANTFGLLNLYDIYQAQGDILPDEYIDLADTILALQTFNAITSSMNVYKERDVNGDKRIGMEEVAYVLQIIAGLRP